MRRGAERLVSLQTFSRLDGQLDEAARRPQELSVAALQCVHHTAWRIDSRLRLCRRRVDSAQLARAAKSSEKPHTTSTASWPCAALSSMCRGPEIELVEKDDDVTTILVDDDKWELASDTPQGAYSRKPIMTLCFAMFANSVALTNVFPYAGFLVLHYGLTADETKVGFYAGYLMTSFMAGRLLSSFYCGALSDRIGRKAVIRIGLWSCLLFSIAFGFSPTFAIALSMRLCMGLFNGLTGVAKAAIPEIVPKGPEQQTAMGYVAGMWRAASSQPCRGLASMA